jgi:hypothetical protein
MSSLRQIIVTGEPQSLPLAAGVSEVGLLARGGDLVVSVGEGSQDVEFDGRILPEGHSVTIATAELEQPHVAVMLVSGGAGVGMLQVTEHKEQG